MLFNYLSVSYTHLDVYKRQAQNRAEALKIMRFLGLVVRQVLLFHLLQKRLLEECRVPKPA